MDPPENDVLDAPRPRSRPSGAKPDLVGPAAINKIRGRRSKLPKPRSFLGPLTVTGRPFTSLENMTFQDSSRAFRPFAKNPSCRKPAARSNLRLRAVSIKILSYPHLPRAVGLSPDDRRQGTAEKVTVCLGPELPPHGAASVPQRKVNLFDSRGRIRPEKPIAPRPRRRFDRRPCRR